MEYSILPHGALTSLQPHAVVALTVFVQRALCQLINDCCLAFCVLVHNDGTAGRRSMRALDLTSAHVTPTIVTLDAHKHLGTDKGVSTVVGSSGTLSHLHGHVRARPHRAPPSSGQAQLPAPPHHRPPRPLDTLDVLPGQSL